MSSLIVGGVEIPVAVNSGPRSRLDAVDRSRMFDNSMKASQTGTAKREWDFATPPVARATADTYETTLAAIAAQTCSGDLLGGSVSCFTEITGWNPVAAPGAHYVELSFRLYEA